MTTETDTQARRRAMGLLARAHLVELEKPAQDLAAGRSVRVLRAPETGLVMLRGRTGGDGAAFNLGEATVTRAVVELRDGARGYGHVLGRDTERARLAAILDALWQTDDLRDRVEAEVLAPVGRRLEAEAALARARTAATRVDFFTLVRGEG